MRPINADAYKEVFEKLRHRRIFPSTRDEIILQNYLDEFPTLDVRENVHGKWLSDEDGNISCSVCGRSGVGESFCEHCGARMDGDK